MTAMEQSPSVLFHSPFESQADWITRDSMKKDESSSTALTQDESTPETSPETDKESIGGDSSSSSSGQQPTPTPSQKQGAEMPSIKPALLVGHPNDTPSKRPKFLDRESFLKRQISDKFCIMTLLDPSTFHDEQTGAMMRAALPAYPTIQEGDNEALMLSPGTESNAFPSVFQKQHAGREDGPDHGLDESLTNDDIFEEVNSVLSGLPKRSSLPNIDYDHKKPAARKVQTKRNSLPDLKFDPAKMQDASEREDDELIEEAAAAIDNSEKEKKKKSKKQKKAKVKKEKRKKSDSKDVAHLVDDEIDKARARNSASKPTEAGVSPNVALNKARQPGVDMDMRSQFASQVSKSAQSYSSPFKNSSNSRKEPRNAVALNSTSMPNLDLDDSKMQTLYPESTRKSGSRMRGEVMPLDASEKMVEDSSKRRKERRSSSSKREDKMKDRSSRRSHRSHHSDPLIDSSSVRADRLHDSSSMLNDISMSSAALHDTSMLNDISASSTGLHDSSKQRERRSSSSKKHRSKKSSSRSKSRKRQEKVDKSSNDIETTTVATEVKAKTWMLPEALAKNNDMSQSALVQVKTQKVTEFGSDDWGSMCEEDDGKMEDHSHSASIVSAVSRKSKKSKKGSKSKKMDTAWDSSMPDFFVQKQRGINENSFRVEDLVPEKKFHAKSSRSKQSNSRPLAQSDPIIRSGASTDTMSTAHQSLPDTPGGNRQGRPPLRPQKNGMGSHPSIASFLSATSLHIPGTPSVASASSTPRHNRRSLRAALQSGALQGAGPAASSAASLTSNASSGTGVSRSTAGRSYADSATTGFSKAYSESVTSRSMADTTTTSCTDRSWKPSQHSHPELSSLLDQGIGQQQEPPQQRRKSFDGASVESEPVGRSNGKQGRSVSTPKGGRNADASSDRSSTPRKLRIGSSIIGRAKARYQGKRHQKFVSED